MNELMERGRRTGEREKKREKERGNFNQLHCFASTRLGLSTAERRPKGREKRERVL